MLPRLPLNINDSEFGPGSGHDITDREGLTDMTKTLLKYHLQVMGRALGSEETPTSSSTPATPGSKQQLVEQYESRARKLLRYCDPDSSPYAWSTLKGHFATRAGMQLYLRRPMSYDRRSGVAISTEPTSVLRLAATVLEREIVLRSDPCGEPFRWSGVVQWHPLAVAITECYACDSIDVLRHVWPATETCFEYIGKVLSEYRQDVLWKSLETLMLKTRARINPFLQERGPATSTHISASTSSVNTPATLDSSVYEGTIMSLPPSSNFAGPTLSATSVAASLPSISSAPSQVDMTAAQNHQEDWINDIQLDASFWLQMEPSISDPGWEVWGDFINNSDFTTNDDTMVK